jgi:hypothetical protein
MEKRVFFVRKRTSFLNIYINSRPRHTELHYEELYDSYFSPRSNQGSCDGRDMCHAKEREEMVRGFYCESRRKETTLNT